MKADSFSLDCTSSVQEAMRRLDSQPGRKILFIVDAERRLLSTLTDGDIRRFLLNGGGLAEQALLASNPHACFAYSVEDARQKYLAGDYLAIPVVDESQRLTGIYPDAGAEETPPVRLGLPVVINAGGKGTRLDPYTRVLPKPLIPVGDTPIIELIMRQFRSFGCDSFHIIVNYKKQLLKAYFSENEDRYDITWYEETEPLGTGGGLCFLKGKLDGTFFFSNCDNLLRTDYESILRFHRKHQNRITVIAALQKYKLPYGVLELGKEGRIETIKEKPELSFLTNTGIYIVEPEVLDAMKDGTAIDFPDIIKQQLRMGNKVCAYPVSESEWLDMGEPEELEKMRVRLYGGRQKRP